MGQLYQRHGKYSIHTFNSKHDSDFKTSLNSTDAKPFYFHDCPAISDLLSDPFGD